MHILFAPIQGYTDSVYRNAHNQLFGNSIYKYYTPFIRVEKGGIRKHDAKEFGAERNSELIEKGVLTPQILPASAEEADYLINELANTGYREIDINLGCPFPMIAKHHKGCGLLPYPDEVKELLDVTERHPDLKFSLKMRLGLEDAYEWKGLTTIINSTPLSHVTIHPRTGHQQYKGEIDLNAFGEMLDSIQHPIVYNGDLLTPADAQKIQEQYPKVGALMIGRGLLANPCLADEIVSGVPTTQKEKAEKIGELHEMLLEGYSNILDGGDYQILAKMKTVWEYLLPEMGKRERKKIEKSKNLQEYCGFVQNALKASY
ncbi:MAG: tRNA-dihydrouridine synthase family protein [Paludibacteraceae bacterium]|nr:tRNA-dihydrouridine synthase family protein [Paludibacteraceae bacterium]